MKDIWFRLKNPAGNYLLKVNNKNTITKLEICSKLTMSTSERHHWRRCGVFIVNFEHILHLFHGIIGVHSPPPKMLVLPLNLGLPLIPKL